VYQALSLWSEFSQTISFSWSQFYHSFKIKPFY